jgi:hypothetical protein
MKVVISWSGEPSQALAKELHSWLPMVIQAVEPWMSDESIRKGAEWRTDLMRTLKDAKVGILCVTQDNQEASWLLFEAGALLKAVESNYVCPYLLGLVPTDLKSPLADFQATEANKDDTLKLLQTINSAQGNAELKDESLRAAFDKWWPDLESKLDELRSKSLPSGPPVPRRTVDDLAAEILARVRNLEGLVGGHRRAPLPLPPSLSKLFEGIDLSSSKIGTYGKSLGKNPETALTELLGKLFENDSCPDGREQT